MTGPFDVTATDIQRLDDDQLRSVLSGLVEAEAKQNGIPLSSIVLGGHQNAWDEGVDAEIKWDNEPEGTDWLPARHTILQSKAEKMPKSKIGPELAPKGAPRRFFQQLSRAKGAYIVFCGSDNCTRPSLRTRTEAMRDAIAATPDASNVVLDFYDASRIARWVNSYQGVANKVLEFAGRPMAGWRPFENWSAPGESAASKYIEDDKPKVLQTGGVDPVPISEAIIEIRRLLREHKIVRLVGVSGVGKTRLAQALFDERVGQDTLNPAQCVYGDLSQSPATSAGQVAEQLATSSQNAILIVDNCPGNTHRALVSIAARPQVELGLLTIDFDVGVDRPENTTVIRLEENEEALIEKLLAARVPQLSSLDRHRVAAFAGGNARVALAIGGSVGSGDCLSTLSDPQLVDRLFLDERRQPDSGLRKCAEIASLVFAFHVEQEGDQPPEHPVLATLAEVSPLQMYRSTAELLDRGVAQKRGTQRAILPQALAHLLAARALERLPHDVILQHFDKSQHPRLFRSFTKRLGHLHNSEGARRIASALIGPSGRLGDLLALDDDELQLFENAAPAAPEAALRALERGVGGAARADLVEPGNQSRSRFASLAHNLAYDVHMFRRAACVLLAFAKAESEDHNDYPTRPHFCEIFCLGLSWTQAPPSLRFGFLDDLLASGDQTERSLAIEALDHALSTGGRSAFHSGQFGSRPRGGEWRPKTQAQQDGWFRGALNRLLRIACDNDDHLANRARSAIAGEIRGLIRIGLVDDLAAALTEIRTRGFWRNGWKHVCEAMFFDSKDWPPKLTARVSELEELLRPKTLKERFDTFVTTEPWGLYLPYPKDPDDSHQDTSQFAQDIGTEVASLQSVWPDLARKACSYIGSSNSHAFGRGLAAGVRDLEPAWRRLVNLLSQVDADHQNAQLLAGFVDGVSVREPDIVQHWLDQAVGDRILGPHIVLLSIALPVDQRSIDRLTRSIELGLAAVRSYFYLSVGGSTDPTPGDGLAAFLRQLIPRDDDGVGVAISILHMKYFSARSEGKKIARELLDVGCMILASDQLYMGQSDSNNRSDGHNLAEIAKVCLAGNDCTETARSICAHLVALGRKGYSRLRPFDPLARVMVELYPHCVCDAVLSEDDVGIGIASHFFGGDYDFDDSRAKATHCHSPEILKWVLEAPEKRATRAARIIRYADVNDEGGLDWTPLALELVSLDIVGMGVLETFEHRFGLGSGWGPWSNRFVRRRPLLEVLLEHENAAIRSCARSMLVSLDEEIEELRHKERAQDERFE